MSLARTLLDLVYPRVCPGCGRPATGALTICWECRAGLEWIGRPFCRVCGDPAEGMIEQAYTCGSCVHARPAFDGARSAARHRGALRDALHAFKYRGALGLADDLAGLLEGCLSAHYGGMRWDAVLCVPLAGKRQRERTYNQAALLASRLSRRMGTPLLRGALRRTRETQTQIHLTARQRRLNVRGAFGPGRTADWVEGRRVLLVDDVMTTGATVNECARVLKSAGAMRVHVVTVARG